MGSANRDESKFDDGEYFDITRPNAREHLSFGFGIHYCLGNMLAKLQAKIALEEVARLAPEPAARGAGRHRRSAKTSPSASPKPFPSAGRPEPWKATNTSSSSTAASTPTLENLGGKGASLVTMTAAGMPVPPGFVVTTAPVRRASCSEAGISGRSTELLAGLDPEDIAQVDQVSAADPRRDICSRPVPHGPARTDHQPPTSR